MKRKKFKIEMDIETEFYGQGEVTDIVEDFVVAKKGWKLNKLKVETI